MVGMYNIICGGNRVKCLKKEKSILTCARVLKKSNICVKGYNNRIEIGKFNGTSTINIFINGNNNMIIIEDDVLCNNVNLWIEDDNNCIMIKSGTLFTGKIQISAIEGSRVEIGNNCLFSSDIDIRTGDGHSIFDISGERINQSKDVIIGDHVWCGKSVSILKGVKIATGSVVGISSVVTKSFEDNNVVLAGNPAAIVKNNITWNYTRV